MTKAELLELLKDYPDDTCVEVVRMGEHFDIECVTPYNDHGVPIAELGIFEKKTIPESVRRGVNYEH
jgi:hypothetical protein